MQVKRKGTFTIVYAVMRRGDDKAAAIFQSANDAVLFAQAKNDADGVVYVWRTYEWTLAGTEQTGVFDAE